VNLDTASLLREASIYARDLFFTLNLTSRQERIKQRGSSNVAGANFQSNVGVSGGARRTVSVIQARKKKTILLSFGSIRAVAGLHDVLLFDAHLPAVRDFASDLHHVFLNQHMATCKNGVEASNITAEPFELLFLESVLRDTVDSYHRRLRLFEPIGTYFITCKTELALVYLMQFRPQKT
jgi:hypothetical protein